MDMDIIWGLHIAKLRKESCLEFGCSAGEASIITLSAPFIDDVAPPSSVSLWFALLSIAPPIGVALGGYATCIDSAA